MLTNALTAMVGVRPVVIGRYVLVFYLRTAMLTNALTAMVGVRPVVIGRYVLVFYLRTAMLTNALTAMVGVRPVVIGGSILFTFSNFMAMFAINVWYLIITLGLMTGQYSIII